MKKKIVVEIEVNTEWGTEYVENTVKSVIRNSSLNSRKSVINKLEIRTYNL